MAFPDNTGSNLSNDVLLAFFLVPPADEWISRMRTKYPGLEVRWALLKEGGKTIIPEQLPPELWEGVTILMITMVAPTAKLLKSVRFIQSGSSGFDRWVGNAAFHDPNVIFANARGVTG